MRQRVLDIPFKLMTSLIMKVELWRQDDFDFDGGVDP